MYIMLTIFCVIIIILFLFMTVHCMDYIIKLYTSYNVIQLIFIFWSITKVVSQLSWVCTPCNFAWVVAVAPLFQGTRYRSNQYASTTLSALVQGTGPPGVLARVGLQMHHRRRTGRQAVAELSDCVSFAQGKAGGLVVV